MDFAESCGDVSFNQGYGFLHRFCRYFILPAVRAEVIAPQDQSFSREANFLCDAIDKITEIGGFHPGIATKLINLIRRCFDQNFTVRIEIKA